MLASLVVAGVLIFIYQDDLTPETLTAFGKRIPALWFIVLFLVLPLAGFPISIFLVLAGLRFGFAGGMAVTTAAVIFHHFAAFRLAHGLFRTRVRRFLARSGYAVPPIKTGHRARFTALFAAIHGPPYAAKLYLLALTDIPFRIYLFVGATVYIFFCMITVGLGSAVLRFDMKWINLIIGCIAALSLAGYWFRRRIITRTG